MYQEKKTVTIGITAYNETKNIRALLKSLVKQTETDFRLEKIIVISDGSKDSMFSEINAVSDSRIELIQYMQRRGKPYRMNEIAQKNTSDILVTIDADVLPNNSNFLTEIIEPFSFNSKIGIVGGAILPASAEIFFEKILNSSVHFKRRLFESIKAKDNIYLCHGRARAFSKEFLNGFRWKNISCEDAYSYLSCINSGFCFYYAPKAEILYRSPQNLRDHLKQSLRFFSGRPLLDEQFGKSKVRESFYIPITKITLELIKYIAKQPHYAFLYFGLVGYVRLMLVWQKRTSSIWDVSTSSKYVVRKV